MNPNSSERNKPLANPTILAIKGLAQFKRYPAVMALGQMIENWHVSDFHISSARRPSDAGYAEHLSREGENLALVTQFMHEHHPKTFENVFEVTCGSRAGDFKGSSQDKR